MDCIANANCELQIIHYHGENEMDTTPKIKHVP